jgi:hypothetical protein
MIDIKQITETLNNLLYKLKDDAHSKDAKKYLN